ncbi:metalloregulator ArsR/SmtB family transcription factor [Acinetobacter sp. ANC 4173]|uniref:metalloregulator ArsR/SmtB family transcription factor n=1 Tax=Acinetobacter sp. ANC 4173 TaxID=2529837 RepID=UPI001038C65E|nr:metalloregulator ArsR/SmtB family transcription factor [Acinetobacter sp. ANC 4173]TCB82378.1 metalloregulator ArsR/SmtB family transcription factor [Acinetobacter sp. ANC 4173]
MDQINFFKCLADETRFNIVMLVVLNHEQCVCDLTEKLQLSQPKISRHLALLRSSGLLQDRRQGQWVYYSLNPNLPTWCVDILNTLNNADLQPQIENSFSQIKSYCE